MVAVPVLLDTCILIDYLRRVPQARRECDRHSDRAISVITWIEVMAGATVSDKDAIREFLANFYMVPISAEAADRAAEIRSLRGPKLSDAIIQATAEVGQRILITRNTRDFSERNKGIRVPYTL